MLIVPQKVKVKWSGNNRKKYESKGYSGFKQGNELVVNIEDIPLTARSKVKIKCDYCENVVEKEYVNIGSKLKTFQEKSHAPTLCCCKCRNEYLKQINSNSKIDRTEFSCDQCGNKYFDLPSQRLNEHHFCCRKCYADYRREHYFGNYMYNYNKEIINCHNCGKEILASKWERDNDNFNFCSQKCYWEFRSKYYVGTKHPLWGKKLPPSEIERIRKMTIQRMANGEFSQTKTSIQELVNILLDKNCVKYTGEYPTKYYVVDNYLNDYNLMIENMGDYWHVNPNKYSTLEKVNKTQRKDINRDKTKHTFILKHFNIPILYLWENDIHNRLDVCEALIKYYIDKKGTIPDYQSFNYFLDDKDNLLLNNNIVVPYFLRNETIKLSS